jgi:hypothetical protein
VDLQVSRPARGATIDRVAIRRRRSGGFRSPNEYSFCFSGLWRSPESKEDHAEQYSNRAFGKADPLSLKDLFHYGSCRNDELKREARDHNRDQAQVREHFDWPQRLV